VEPAKFSKKENKIVQPASFVAHREYREEWKSASREKMREGSDTP
jgi:hypothetical protein